MKVYVGNLSKQVTDAQLKDLAVPYGTLVSANVATERPGGESKGFGSSNSAMPTRPARRSPLSTVAT